MVGTECYETALGYVRRHAVTSQRCPVGQNELWGLVHGTDGEFYTPVVYFSRHEQWLKVRGTRCSCRARRGCAHAAALLISATQEDGYPPGLPALPSPAVPSPAVASPALPAQQAGAPTWDTVLRSLLPAATTAGRPDRTTLAIELGLVLDWVPEPAGIWGEPAAGGSQPGLAAGGSQPGLAAVRLMARLVQPSRAGGWIGGTLTWSKLGQPGYWRDYPAPAVRLLREMLAVYRANGSRPRDPYAPGYYSTGEELSIELSAFESSCLWPLLDEAEDIGVRLVYPRGLGPVQRYRNAEVCLDITKAGPDGPLAITPVVSVEGADGPVVPVRFIGTQGHGVVYLDAAEARRGDPPTDWRFRLARLARPVSARWQEMVLAGRSIEVPAAQRADFRDRFYLRLRQSVAVLSTDGSFTPPVISGPTLVLCASYGEGHDVALDWRWAYQVGETGFRLDLDQAIDGAGYRDVAAEQAILDALARDGLGPRRRRLSGMDTARFSAEMLPKLASRPGVAVEVTGEPADYREASLLIGVSTDEVAGDDDWFDLGITITLDGREVPFAVVFTALTLGERNLLLADGTYCSLDRPRLRRLARLIAEARALQEPGGQDRPLRISRFQAGLWEELAGLGVVVRQALAWQRQVQGLLEAVGIDGADGIGDGEPPVTLHALLRPYQLDGFRWLRFLRQHRLGGILADDMGLGKTVQALAMICDARQAAPGGPPFLIVAPTSVVPNWTAETERFAPELKTVTITDTLARSGADLGQLTAGANVVITSYTLLRLDFAAHAATQWSGLILDEAQQAKNYRSKIYQCVRRLPAPVKIAMTGTPMENNLMELWALLSITAPGLFPDPERFREYYARPIERKGDAELLAGLRRRIRPLVRRRTKEQVAADLPAKQEQVLMVDLHPRHRKIYQTHLQRERQKVLGLIDDVDANRFTILGSLTKLRQLSLHAALIDDVHYDIPAAKVDALLDQIRSVAAGGHRALVFSQFTRFLALVRERLDVAGVASCYLDGKTRDRAGALREFREGTDPVFLISLKAGGFGLNLTEADYCFLLDPWWNPATEAQAIDRTHRIGQTRNVMVYRLIAAGTIEEKVIALQARKAALFSQVVDDGGMFGGSLDADDIRALFT